MLRQHSVEHYLERLEALRKSNPNIVLSTDIIAGFPNETEQEHQQTLELLKKAKFDFIYSYKFSPRKGTKAAKMPDILNNEIRGARLQEIQKLQLSIQAKVREKMIGKTYRVLVEGKGSMKSDPGVVKWNGRTSCFRIVHFIDEDQSRDLLWNWVDVEITDATALSCQGKIVKIIGKQNLGS